MNPDPRQPPAFRRQTHKRRPWQRTPPAIFPPVLGLFCLGMGWRRGAEVSGLPAGIAEGLLGAVSLLFLFCLLAYLGKLVQRPGALQDDLATLPGRAGLATANLSLFLLAVTLLPYAPMLAGGLIGLGVLCQALLAANLLWRWSRGGQGVPSVTPVWHLVLVSWVMASLGLIGLGKSTLALGIAVVVMVPALAIWAVSLWQLVRRIPPAPLRPLLAIHLAPASLLAIVWALLGQPGIAALFTVLAVVIFLALLASAQWLVQAGFSPMWGAFTFPLSAFANALLANGWPVAGLLMLAAASAVIPPIALWILRDWARGGLAVRTNAAAV